MGKAFDKTFNVLRRSKNDTVSDVLLAGLESALPEIRQNAVAAIVFRRNSSAHQRLIEMWEKLEPSLRDTVKERPGRLPDTLRNIVTESDHPLCKRACQVALEIDEYDLIPALAHAAENEEHQHHDVVLDTILQLADNLQHLLSLPRDYENRRDPQLMRVHIVTALEGAVERYERHESAEVIEAFLVLTRHDNALLQKILANTRHPAHAAVREAFHYSDRPGVMRLVVALLEPQPVARLVLDTLADREDADFIARFAAVVPEFGDHALKCLKRIKELGLTRAPESLLNLEPEHQAAVVGLIESMGISEDAAFAVYQLILERGATEARQIAAKNLARFRGADANELCVRCLDDEDPEVQATLTAQVRERGIPDALSLLIAKTESPYGSVRSAAQKCLGEFHFERFSTVFDVLSEEMKGTTGRLVRRADPDAVPKLKEELKSGSRMKRMRGLQIAVAIEAVDDVIDDIVGRLSDEDHFVRAEAAKALGFASDEKAVEALREALLDRSLTVQNAAESSLYQQTHGTIPASPTRP